MVGMHDRTTKYVTAVRKYIEHARHASNAELLDSLHKVFPDLSATTVHRITTRMLERGELQLAPSGQGNVMRFDANVAPHDHFMCERCGLLRDADLGVMVRPFIEKAIGDDCSISGNLTVTGICKQCNKGRLVV